MESGEGRPGGLGQLPEQVRSPAREEVELAVFAALADPTRRRLLVVLVELGRASVTAVSNRLPVSRQAVSKHLRVLEAAALVAGVRSGRETLYEPRLGALDAAARWLADLSAAWNDGQATAVAEPIERRSSCAPSHWCAGVRS